MKKWADIKASRMTPEQIERAEQEAREEVERVNTAPLMTFNDIRPGNEDDVRAFLSRRPSITGEEYGMLANLFADMEQGFAIVHRIVEELGVEVTPPPYL
jgi:DNA-directed RNA polymerase subunit F